jgi:four helix bundle protein
VLYEKCLEVGCLEFRVLELLNKCGNMNNKEFSKELEARTRRFAITVISLSTKLPNTPEGKTVRHQFTKAGTSVGANYREANRSISKADFKYKIKICESEASETCYWLEILMDLPWLEKAKILPLLSESNELLSIFTSTGKHL